MDPQFSPLFSAQQRPQLTLAADDRSYVPNAVKKIMTKPRANSAKAANSLHTTLYHCFPTTDQQSWIANQNATTAIRPNSTT
jgi:hypothetical protein